MLEFAMGAKFVWPLSPGDSRRVGLTLLERQTQALEHIAAQLRVLEQEPPLERQPQFVLATRRLLEEPI